MQLKVTPAMKQVIHDASPHESTSSIAARLGIRSQDVYYHRNKKLKKADKPRAPHAKPEPRITHVDCRSALANTAQATFLVTDKIVDNWWKGLTLGDKAAIFSSNYVIRLEGSVQ